MLRCQSPEASAGTSKGILQTAPHVNTFLLICEGRWRKSRLREFLSFCLCSQTQEPCRIAKCDEGFKHQSPVIGIVWFCAADVLIALKFWIGWITQNNYSRLRCRLWPTWSKPDWWKCLGIFQILGTTKEWRLPQPGRPIFLIKCSADAERDKTPRCTATRPYNIERRHHAGAKQDG